jgi:hypothetical protein
MAKLKAWSVRRWRADAAECKRRGLKVGSTKTQFGVQVEGGEIRYYSALAATPGERMTIAKRMYAEGLPSERYLG